MDLEKTVVRAGVSGRVEQFVLRVGDIVNPIMRPAGILIPDGAGRRSLQAGFGQIEAQIMKVGMMAEVTCVSKPWTIIPMVVTDVQDFIAAGQFRGGEQLIDAQQVTRPGTLLVFLEPLYKGGLDDVTPGSSCIANAYSNNHDMIVAKGHRRHAAHRSSRRGCPRARARLDSAAAGAGASLQDPRVQRSLTLRSTMRITQEVTKLNLSRVTKFGSALLVAAVMLAGAPSSSYAENGSVRMKISKVGFIVGVGGGSGTLTFKGKKYRLSIGGVSAGTIGVAEHGPGRHRHQSDDRSRHCRKLFGRPCWAVRSRAAQK